MGTNYYLHRNICGCCKRYDRYHIGKSSAGWQFTFRAYDYEDAPLRIRNYRDWQDEILEDGIKIFDEYGGELKWTEFLTLVERKRSEPRNHASEYPGEYDYVDGEGYSFTNREFS